MAGEPFETDRTMVLLGAGASRDAGLPDTGGMTEQIVRRLQDTDWVRPEVHALNYVVSAIIGHRGARGESPYATIDVERVFSGVQLLGERRDHEAAPFISAWQPGVEAFDTHPTPSTGTLSRAIGRALEEEPGNLDTTIANFARAATSPGDGQVYRRLQTLMLDQLCQVLQLKEPGRAAYLEPLGQFAKEQRGGLDVATLNYDLAVEAACAGLINVDTGLTSWMSDRSWRWSRDGIRLLKLHGSIDWKCIDALSVRVT